MEFKSLRNIESSFRQIRLFGIVFLSLCAVVTVWSVWNSYRFAEKQREKIYVLDNGKSLMLALSQDLSQNRPAEAREHEPVRRSGNELWYIAPYRGERTPSFRVNVAKQLWYDFGLGKGGDIFTLAGEFLQSDDFMAQAKFIAETANMTVTGWGKPTYLPKPIEPVFEDVEVAPLLRSLLTEYLSERGIPYAIASRHCCRLNYGVRGKRYFAVGFPNIAGGYEVRSRFFKGCIPPKSVSLVKANDIPTGKCLVFEGFMLYSLVMTAVWLSVAVKRVLS